MRNKCEILALSLGIYLGVFSCDYPNELQSSTWYDSGKGALTFSTNRMSGWSVPVYSSAVNSWDCFMKNGKYILSRSSTVVNVFSVDYYAYLCMDVTMVTSHSYYYYLRHDPQQNANDERVYVIESTIDVTSIDQACTPTSGPATEEFHVLVRQGNESSARSWCPSPLLGSFWYTYDDGSGSTSCGAGSVWDVCTDRTTMSFNYTLCSTVLAYSQEGKVYCTVYLQSGSTSYVSVFNPGTVDGVSFYRFTCFSVTYSGSTVYASQRPGECEVGQTPQTAPSDGAKVTLMPYYTCPFTSASSMSTSTGSGVYAGAVAGIVLGILLSVIALVAVLVLYKKYKKNNNRKEENLNISKNKVSPTKPYDVDPLHGYMKRGYTFEREPTIEIRNNSEMQSSIMEELDQDVTYVYASQR